MRPKLHWKALAPIAALLIATSGCGDDDSAQGHAGLPTPPTAHRHHPHRHASASAASPTTQTPLTTATQAPEIPPVREVLAISIDGLNPAALKTLGPKGASTFWSLIDQGASTLNARTDREQTVTLPNHASMLTGRRVDAAAGGHGWTSDEDTGKTIQNPAGTPVPSIFDVVQNAGLSSALFANKSKFAVFDRSWPAIDLYEENDNPGTLVADARQDLTSHHRAFTFLHLALPDHAGHDFGWLSPEYLDAVRETDQFLGDVVYTIDNDRSLSQHLVLVVTADHGGTGHGHTAAADEADYTIPFIVRGPGVPVGADLYALNPERRDPGTDRTEYSGPQPIRDGDVANLAARLLGLPTVAGSQFGLDTDPLEVTASD